MTYRIGDKATLQIFGEFVAKSFVQAANQMCRQRWNVNFDNAIAAGFVTLDNLIFSAKSF